MEIQRYCALKLVAMYSKYAAKKSSFLYSRLPNCVNCGARMVLAVNKFNYQLVWELVPF